MGRKPVKGICRLCDQDSELKESHIIPRFFYKEMRNEKGVPFRYKILICDSDTPIREGQGGVKEYLFCDQCEEKLSAYETYASQVLNGGAVQIRGNKVDNILNLSNIDYKKFKLFQMSILWRASVSSDMVFAPVDLGPHEDIVKKMIQEENPGEPEQYGCWMCMILNNGVPFNVGVNVPGVTRMNGHRIVRFIFGAIAWSYFVSSHSIKDEYKKPFINTSGRLSIVGIDAKQLGIIHDLAASLHKKLKLDN